MPQVQFGLGIPLSPSDLPPQEFMKQIRASLDVITGHFDSIWIADHLQFGDRTIFEGWTILNYLAALYPDFKYGHLVLCQLFRNPALLAKMAATAQYVSQGKFILGLGAGWAEEEAKSYHIPFPAPGQRVSEFKEQLQIINALWREDKVTFEGKYHQVTDAYCLPHPDPIPPILIAAFQPRMMRITARYADWWNASIENLDKAKEQMKALDAACEAIGRDPKTVRRTGMITCYCAPTESKLKELTAKPTGPFGLGFVGTPSQIAEQLQPYIELGFDYFMISAGGVPADTTTLEMLAHEVLPALNKR
jgi:alkanesulfonate monooxygenase SsuD/methylene tetrahydromethanopterin reductase-like flavin-dependent oxidoreductase (luciferase family)